MILRLALCGLEPTGVLSLSSFSVTTVFEVWGGPSFCTGLGVCGKESYNLFTVHMPLGVVVTVVLLVAMAHKTCVVKASRVRSVNLLMIADWGPLAGAHTWG